ncbi:MAG: hypothetical protein NC938_04655 [Candidatus Omnitrophica bacterium]|nr:hypothetical protein [Candidatus Omnitrophota bacterium]MCM8790974.1 hypothetical protein [Candidatus Omnitrophota bacterium]
MMHAICVFKYGTTYSYISNREMIKTKGRTLIETINQQFPDWEKIIYMSDNGDLGQAVERGYSINIAANNLSASLLHGNILGAEYKDMGIIKVVMHEQLASFARTKMPLNIGTFITILKDKRFDLGGRVSITFMFDKLELTSCGFRVLCRAEDSNEKRYYHALFSINGKKDEGFSVVVYSDEEWKRLKGYKGIMPYHRIEEDAAILEKEDKGGYHTLRPVEAHPM